MNTDRSLKSIAEQVSHIHRRMSFLPGGGTEWPKAHHLAKQQGEWMTLLRRQGRDWTAWQARDGAPPLGGSYSERLTLATRHATERAELATRHRASGLYSEEVESSLESRCTPGFAI